MATPIAHKGTLTGAKVLVLALTLTLFDLMTKPDLRAAAADYFKNVQTKDQKYIPFLRPTDKPSIFLNTGTQEKYRPLLKPFYYDATKYGTYLEQLGIKYPTVRTATTQVAPAASDDVEDTAQ